MKILHLASADRQGGACIAAYRLHSGLLRYGLSSEMLVNVKVTTDRAVKGARPSVIPLTDRLRRRVAAQHHASELKRNAPEQSPRLELFSSDRVAGRNWLSELISPADVYNLHWVAGFLDYQRFFSGMAPYTPLVWTLHDMNPFTGGCHYSLGCMRFRENCGACPLLGSKDERDLSARIHRRKYMALSACKAETTRIVTPSKWIEGQASSSSLLGRFKVERIPYGLDTDVYAPRSLAVAREVLGLPQNAKIVLFVSDAISNHRKGFDLLLSALELLPKDMPVSLAAIGDRASESMAQRMIDLGRMDDERLMSLAYSAADVFVMPSRAENFGMVVFEAMACGTPVVAFDVGGIPDMVRPGVTGLLAPPEDVRALAAAIETVLKDDELRERMSLECRQIAVNEYSLHVQAARYAAVYEDLIESF